MRGGITAVAALVLLGALWFLAGDDDGRNAVPRLFDNMNDRPLADAQQVGISSAAPDRKTRLAPPRSVAQSLGMNGTVRKREDDRDSFAAEGSYFPPAACRAERRIPCLWNWAASPAAATCWRRGARFIWRIAPFATERTEADAEAWPLMTPIRK